MANWTDQASLFEPWQKALKRNTCTWYSVQPCGFKLARTRYHSHPDGTRLSRQLCINGHLRYGGNLCPNHWIMQADLKAINVEPQLLCGHRKLSRSRVWAKELGGRNPRKQGKMECTLSEMSPHTEGIHTQDGGQRLSRAIHQQVTTTQPTNHLLQMSTWSLGLVDHLDENNREIKPLLTILTPPSRAHGMSCTNWHWLEGNSWGCNT